jgi:hypothetical protein
MPDIVTALRQNHALEHATIHLLSRRHPQARLVGRSTPAGFVLYGDLSTEEVAHAATEALVRLQAGESHLAIHPRCGTNVAVTGILVGAAGFSAGLDRRRSWLERLPLALMAATLAAFVAQPLALLVQERLTTTPRLEGVYVADVSRHEAGRFVSHSVTTGR